MKIIFIAGTDTDIGKTFSSAFLINYLISLKQKVIFYKPVQSGCEDFGSHLIAPDIDFIQKNCSNTQTHCSYYLKLAATPELAAKQENIIIDFNLIKNDYAKLINQNPDFLIVEGAGGLIVPLGGGKTLADLILFLQKNSLNHEIFTLLISANKLGTINQTCLSAFYAQSLGLNLIGFLFCYSQSLSAVDNEVKQTNAKFIEEYGKIKFLGEIPYQEPSSENNYFQETALIEIANKMPLTKWLKNSIV